MSKPSEKIRSTGKSAPSSNKDFWSQWIVLYTAAFCFLAIPSLCIWISRGFTVTEHEFDFFLGLLDFGKPNQIYNMFSPGKTVHVFMWGAIGFLFWMLTMRLYRAPTRPVPISFNIIIAISLVSAITLPYISPDVFFYLGTGWLEAHYHLNPFRNYISAVPGSDSLPMFSNVYSGFRSGFSCYGPIFQKIAALFAWASFGSIRWGLIFWKLNNWLFHLVNCGLVFNLAKSLKLDAKRVRILFGLNPLILFSLLACVHNDAWLLFCFLAAIWCAHEERAWLAMLVLGVGTNLKYVPVLLVPFFILYFVRDCSWPKKLVKGYGYFLLFALIIMAGHFLYGEGVSNAFRVVGGGVNVYRNCIYYYLGPLLQVPIADWSRLKQMMNYIYIFAYGCMLCRAAFGSADWTLPRLLKYCLVALLLYLLVACEGVQEWYLCWLLPFGYLLEGNARYRYFILALSTLFLPLVIYTIKTQPFISFIANAILYLLVLYVSYKTLLDPKFRYRMTKGGTA